MVIGEHGDSEMIPWSTVRIGGKDIYSVVQDNQSRFGQENNKKIKKNKIQAGWVILNIKWYTFFFI